MFTSGLRHVANRRSRTARIGGRDADDVVRRGLANALLIAIGIALTIFSFLIGRNTDIAILKTAVRHYGEESTMTDSVVDNGPDIVSTSVFELHPVERGGEDDRKNDRSIPSGGHLLVDMKNVDRRFISSEVRIANAMTYLVEEMSVAKRLSTHCRPIVHAGMGVNCHVFSSDGRISLRTWPKEGVIVMDVFTLGASTLSIPVLLPIIKRLFAIPGDDTVDPTGPKIIWSHKLRGFREGYIPGYRRHDNPLETDLGLDALRMHYLVGKEVLISAKTKFQHVDVYEVINPRVNSLARHEGSPSNDGSYESHNPGSHGPDRILYLDGVQQSSLYGDAAYHEALVHPSMLVHPNPRRVAIIGGGEGATLREVLKHNTVEEVVMVEIDEELVALCREHLPEWSDCTDHGGSDATSCFDDSRVTVSFEDAFAWFVESFGGAKGRRERFDVIIMDALDPDHYVEIVGALYRDDQFVSSIYQGLTKEGVFVVQMGQANENDDSSLEIGTTKDSAAMASDKIATLESAGFQSMHGYDEGHCGYFSPWSYLVCFKDFKSRASWYGTTAGIDIRLHQRVHKTKSGKPSLLYFDASTMLGYQLPSKVDETVYCRKVIKPWECDDDYHGFDPKIVNPISNLKVHEKALGNIPTQNLTVYSPLLERRSRRNFALGSPNIV